MRWMLTTEILSVLAFAGVAAWSMLGAGQEAMPTIDVAALATGSAEEQWMGIFVQDSHVGYAVSRQTPAGEGLIFQQRSQVKINSMGSVQTLITAGTALVDGAGRLQSFDFVISGPFPVSGRGEVQARNLRLQISQGGASRTLDIPIQEPPVIGATMGLLVRGRTLAPGMEFKAPFFDPTTMSNSEMTVRVEAPAVLPNGDVAWWLSTEIGGFRTRRLVDERGNTLREESALLSTRRMSREEATALPDADPPDLVALASVPFDGPLPDPRRLSRLRVQVHGVDVARFAQDPPLQSLIQDTVTVSVPLAAELAPLPVAGQGDTEATSTLPADDPEIVAKAREVIGDAPTRLEAARRLNQFVFEYVRKVPTISVPNGLDVLRRREGDCNEHTALYVSLARAVDIPARIAAGLVYSERLGRAFYYHAWPEVRLSEPDGWIPVDPTFGQFPADATHIKIVNGDLERQVEIMGMMGQIRLTILPDTE